jgi:hypothetical protein
MLNTGHEYGKLEDTMKEVELQHKGPYINTVQKLHVYSNKLKGYWYLMITFTNCLTRSLKHMGDGPFKTTPPSLLIQTGYI